MSRSSRVLCSNINPFPIRVNKWYESSWSASNEGKRLTHRIQYDDECLEVETYRQKQVRLEGMGSSYRSSINSALSVGPGT